VLQSVPVKPGETYLASVHVRGQLGKQAESELVIQWQDAAGKWLTKAPKRSDRLPAGGSREWTRLSTFVQVPEGAGRLIFSVSAYHQTDADALHIDDASLRRLP
jgi:hypothetical protein